MTADINPLVSHQPTGSIPLLNVPRISREQLLCWLRVILLNCKLNLMSYLGNWISCNRWFSCQIASMMNCGLSKWKEDIVISFLVLLVKTSLMRILFKYCLTSLTSYSLIMFATDTFAFRKDEIMQIWIIVLTSRTSSHIFILYP